jgi:endo-1,4-beta-xylanase
LGLKIVISELDVNDSNLSGNIETRDRLVAEAYSDFLAVALDHRAVIVVTTWGLSDRYSWLSWNSPSSNGTPLRPLPYSQDLQPKPALIALKNAFKKAPKR